MTTRYKMDVIGDYEYNRKEILGHGAFAIVFKGRKKENTSVPVAVKCITKKNIAKSQQLLSKEIKILSELSTLKHENVVALLDCKETANHVYLVMEYCNGGDLAEYLASQGTLTEDTLSSFLRQIAGAMKAMNAKGIVHRDLKPQNILLCCKGPKATTPPSQMQLKIADFGFARFLQDGVMAATLCGSPMYMAPEVIMSLQYDAKADLWSIGTIVFQCLTGKAPFQAQTPQQLKQFYEKHADLQPKIPEGTSPELRDLLLRLLKRNAKDRIEFEDFFVHPFLQKAKPLVPKTVSKKRTSSPVTVPRRTPSVSSEGSTPSKTAGSSPSVAKAEEVEEMTRTLTDSHGQDTGFTKVEKPAVRPDSPTAEDFVLVPKNLAVDIPENGGKPNKTLRAPLAEEEYDVFGESTQQSVRPVNLSAAAGKATFHREEHDRKPSPTAKPPSPTAHFPPHPKQSPASPAPSPPVCQNSSQHLGSSTPIPVPSPARLSQQIRDGTGSPLRSGTKKRSTSADSSQESDKAVAKKVPESTLSGPDVSSMSPPSVQFSIGTPPTTGSNWKRSSIGGSPISARAEFFSVGSAPVGSPLRRSASCSPGTRYTSAFSGAPSSLPTISGSPTRNLPTCHLHHPHYHHHHFAGKDPYLEQKPGFHRYPTVPDCVAVVTYPEMGREQCHRCGTEPDLTQAFNHHHMLRAAFSTHQHPHAGLGTIIPWSGSRERLVSLGTDKERGSPSALEHERAISATPRRNSMLMETSPPSSLMFAASPPNMEGPIMFVAPELSEETLMDEQHNLTMAKLSFVLDLVECILELAEIRGSGCNPLAESVSAKQADVLPAEQVPKFTEAQRRLEQLVLYIRSLHLLSSSISLANNELRQDRLQSASSLRKVLMQMNELYQHCMNQCRVTHEKLGANCKTPLTPQMVVNTADKLIYNYAVEQCQSAALDELFGNPKECFRRYTVAQILLHSLAQQTQNVKDRHLLNKYKESVERRLSNLGSPSVVHQCETCS
ncbi:serine/threonine-protein kinase unc-51-like isoform X1 [Pomacea canaliculata]|uniref:serine/threonine-protein kinase unc-51-like isoform X1 n=2 Tax=Pomacea canaliculata TaxID=400727 RepID=UPI000D73C1E8|nr:serine/threonine-protein kinase unc-51-like isoform X1 [Pomacea canaliculata]